MKAINVGKMNKRIWILGYEEVEDEMCQNSQKLRKKKKIWADVRPIRGGEYYESLKLSPEISYILYIRYREGINTDSLILYHDKILEVKYPIDVEEQHILLELQCVEKPKKEVIGWAI